MPSKDSRGPENVENVQIFPLLASCGGSIQNGATEVHVWFETELLKAQSCCHVGSIEEQRQKNVALDVLYT